MNDQCFLKDDVVTIKPEFKEKMSSIGLNNYEGLFIVTNLLKQRILIAQHLRTGRYCYIPTEYLEPVSKSPAFLDMPVTLL